MTCYQQHMGWLFEAVGLPLDKEAKREMHGAIVAQLGLADDVHCPELWAALKGAYGIDAHTQSAELAADMAARLGEKG